MLNLSIFIKYSYKIEVKKMKEKKSILKKRNARIL